MSDPGALKTNDGRTKIIGPDRHQQRAREQRAKPWEAAHTRADKKATEVKSYQEKGAESESTGPGTRRAQRQRALVGVAKERKDAQPHHATLTAQASTRGPPRERADRDFRTQTIMTWRTLLLENALMAFMGALCERLQTTVRLDGLVRLLLARSGARLATASQVV